MLTIKKLRVVDEEDNLAIDLSADDGYSTINLYGDPGASSSSIYVDSAGHLILWGADGTFVCLWEGRLGVCEQDEDGFLAFVDP